MLEFCCPKASAVVKGIGFNPSEKKWKQSNERVKQIRNSSSLIEEFFQLPQEINVKDQVSFLVNKYYVTERTKHKKHFTEMRCHIMDHIVSQEQSLWLFN